MSQKNQLSKDQIEILISLVRERQCLYDLQHKDYHKQDIKENNWKQIGSQMNIDGKFSNSFIIVYHILIIVLKIIFCSVN